MADVSGEVEDLFSFEWRIWRAKSMQPFDLGEVGITWCEIKNGIAISLYWVDGDTQRDLDIDGTNGFSSRGSIAIAGVYNKVRS